MIKFPAIAILLLANLSQAIPQNYEFYHERQYIREDINNEFVNYLLHDSKGFMWFAVRAGLHRYDGYSFKSYFHHEPDTSSLSDNQVITMCDDHEKNIWIGTLGGGLNRYNRETDDFTRYPRSLDDPYNLRNSSVWAICVRRSGTIWFSAHSSLSQGVYVLDPQTGQVNPVIHDTINPGHLASIHTRSICEDRSGDIWTGNAEGLHKFNAAKGSFFHYRNDPGDPSSISNDTVISIFEDRSGKLWIGTCNGLNQFDSKREQFIRYVHEPDNPKSLNGNFIGAITEDIEGNLIIKTTTGINFLDKQRRTFKFWEYSDLSYPFTPRSDFNYFISIRGLDLDTCGILWFTTTTRIDKLILKKKKFTLLRSIYSLSSIYEDNTGDLWVGTWYNGLYRIITDHSGRTLGSLKNIIWDGTNPVSGMHHYNNNPEDPYSLSSDCITSICQDREGTMWIGGGHSGILYKLDPSDKRERFIPYRQDSLVWITEWKLIRVHEDRSGNLWIGRDIGLEIFNRETEKFMPYDLDPEKHEFQNIPFINAICEGDSGCIWIGTWYQGLFKIIPPFTISTSGTAKGDRTVSYKYDQEVPKDLGDHPVLSLCAPKIRKTAELWIGTNGGGLFGLTREESSPGKYTERFIHYTTSDGLSSNTIYGILDDDRGNLWIATTNGLSRFDPESGEFNRFDESDGVLVREFGWLSGHKGKKGKMFFGAAGGLIAFHPDSITDNPNIPPVVITEFKLFNKPVPIGEDSPLKMSITEMTEMELSYRQNYLSFEYAALNYINTERNRYKYKMEGLDKDWIEAGYQRLASYSNLKPGKYTFRVLGSNNDGVWNEEGASLGIVIHPPPWRTWWAYIIYGLIIIGIIRWYRNFLINREKLKADLQLERIEVEKVQELERTKARFFSNISHEFRTPLTLILGPLERLISSRPKVKEWDWNVFDTMQRNASKLKILINQILDISKLESGQIKLQISEGNITDFLNNIVLSFLSLAESKNIIYKYRIAESSAPLYFDKDKLDKIACNLIGNAFKFTPDGGKISVKLVFIPDEKDNAPDYLELSVRDSGRGIPGDQFDKIFDRFYQMEDQQDNKQEGTGLGLALTKELIDLYRGEIKLKSEPGKGSVFTVRLPVAGSHFSSEEIIEPGLEETGETFTVQVEMPEEEIMEHERLEMMDYLPGRPILLIVEDNPDLRKYIIQCLDTGFSIHESGDGREGLDKARELIPDLIISDIMMPGIDGIEMCEKLKTDVSTSHIPIIMLTAKGDMGSKIEGLQTGADDYIIKPFDAKELLVRVNNLIEQRKKLRERYRKEMVLGADNLGLPQPDEKFLTRVNEVVNKHISEPEYSVSELAVALGMSRSQLYRKILALTDHSASEFMRNTRLKYAAGLFDQGYQNVTEVTFQAGFNSPSYFASCFRKLYGKNPKQYIAG